MQRRVKKGWGKAQKDTQKIGDQGEDTKKGVRLVRQDRGRKIDAGLKKSTNI